MTVYTYKGVDKNILCRGFQYDIGGKYETGGAKACGNGYYGRKVPLKVFSFYPPNKS